MKEGIGMLFKKKTLDEKMEKYVKHHDWYAIQEVITEYFTMLQNIRVFQKQPACSIITSLT